MDLNEANQSSPSFGFSFAPARSPHQPWRWMRINPAMNFSGKEEIEVVERKLSEISEENKRLSELVSDLLWNHRSGSDRAQKRKRLDCEEVDYVDETLTNRISSSSNNSLKVRADDLCKIRSREDNLPNSTTSTICMRTNYPKHSSMVQRSAEDASLLVATYEGEHNHERHNHAQVHSGSMTGVLPHPKFLINSSSPAAAATQHGSQLPHHDVERLLTEIKSKSFSNSQETD